MGVGNADACQDQNDLWPNNLTTGGVENGG